MEEENKNQEAVLEEPTGEELAGETPTGDDAPTGKEGKSDPLDEINDVEILRAEAKKYRGISNRTARKGDERPAESPKAPEAPATDYVTKKDLEVRAEKSAIKSMTTIADNDNDSVKAMKEDIADNWDEISTYYVNRSGREEPEQIAKDIRAAYILWADEKGRQADISQLTAVAVTKGSSGKKVEKKTEDDPRFREKPKPTDWYK